MNTRTPNEHDSQPNDSDDLLEEVARVARDDEMADSELMERMKKLAAGELADGELAELRAEAERSEELARDLEVFRPLGDEFHDRVVGRLQDESEAPQASQRAEVIPIDRAPRQARHRRRTWPWPSLAAAAVVVVLLAPWLYHQVAAPFQYPDYSMDLAGAIQDVRGDETPREESSEELPEFGPGSILQLTVTPDVEPGDRPDFTFYFADDQGDLIEWDTFTRAGASARLEEELSDDLVLAPGVWTVFFVYGEPGELPSPRVAADLQDESRRWRAVTRQFRVLPGNSASAELPLDILYSGCYSVSVQTETIHPQSREPECVPQSSDLSVWARSEPDAEIEVRLLGDPLELEGLPIDGGIRFTVPVTADNESLELVAELNGLESRTFRLHLVPNREPEWLVEARRLAVRGNAAEAREALHRNLDTADAAARGSAAGLMARLVDDAAEREAWLETSVDSMRQTGEVLRRFKNLEMLWHTYLQAGQIDRVRRGLAEIEDPPAEYPGEVQVLVPLYRGLMYRKTGDFRSALPAQRRASEIARRLGLSQELRTTETRLATTLQLLGRGTEADVLLRSVASSPDFEAFDRCFRAEVLTTHGWILLLNEDPRALSTLDSATELVAAHLVNGLHCDAGLRLTLGLNRAMALERQGLTFESRRVLAELESGRSSAGTLHQLWWHDLEGRLSLHENAFDQALQSFRAMEALADTAYEPRAHWRAKLQIARALEDSGRVEAALKAYAAAEELLDERSLDVPLDVGREHFVADREVGTRRYLELLLDHGRAEEAFQVARRSRSRVLRSIRRGHRLANLSLEQRARWDLSVSRYLDLRRRIENDTAELWKASDFERRQLLSRQEARKQDALLALDQAFLALELRRETLLPMEALGDHELVLAYHPLTDGWAGFASLDGDVKGLRLDLGVDLGASDPLLSGRLLAPFSRQIDSARTIRILASGELATLDFHALPWGDDVLLRHKTVVYGLDIVSAALGPGPVDARERRVLVVGDPRNDLPAAAREAEAVASALARRADSYDVERLLGPAATPAAVRDSLRRANLFHLAGHSTFGGHSGWASGFLLAGDRTMTLGDVLSLEQAPAHVVLSSCESARATDRSPAGLGLAQAFIIAGSRHVVASLRPVSDGTTELLFRRLYADGGVGIDLPERMRRAQLAWRQHDAPDDWASFRILVP